MSRIAEFQMPKPGNNPEQADKKQSTAPNEAGQNVALGNPSNPIHPPDFQPCPTNIDRSEKENKYSAE